MSPSMYPAPAKVIAGHGGPIRGILFDKDGTLFDFCATWIPAYRTAAAEIGDLAGGVDVRMLLADAGFDAATDTCDPHSVLAAGTNLELATAWATICGFANNRSRNSAPGSRRARPRSFIADGASAGRAAHARLRGSTRRSIQFRTSAWRTSSFMMSLSIPSNHARSRRDGSWCSASSLFT